jgi:hypothetical protein
MALCRGQQGPAAKSVSVRTFKDVVPEIMEDGEISVSADYTVARLETAIIRLPRAF